MATELNLMNLNLVQMKTRTGAVDSVRPVTKDVTARQAEHSVVPEQSTTAAQRNAEKPENLDQMVSELNDLVQELRRELQFSVDEDNGDTIVKIIDKNTEEVIRQIPSEEVLALRKRLEEMSGVIFRGSA